MSSRRNTKSKQVRRQRQGRRSRGSTPQKPTQSKNEKSSVALSPQKSSPADKQKYVEKEIGILTSVNGALKKLIATKEQETRDLELRAQIQTAEFQLQMERQENNFLQKLIKNKEAGKEPSGKSIQPSTSTPQKSTNKPDPKVQKNQAKKQQPKKQTKKQRSKKPKQSAKHSPSIKLPPAANTISYWYYLASNGKSWYPEDLARAQEPKQPQGKQNQRQKNQSKEKRTQPQKSNAAPKQPAKKDIPKESITRKSGPSTPKVSKSWRCPICFFCFPITPEVKCVRCHIVTPQSNALTKKSTQPSASMPPKSNNKPDWKSLEDQQRKILLNVHELNVKLDGLTGQAETKPRLSLHTQKGSSSWKSLENRQHGILGDIKRLNDKLDRLGGASTGPNAAQRKALASKQADLLSRIDQFESRIALLEGGEAPSTKKAEYVEQLQRKNLTDLDDLLRRLSKLDGKPVKQRNDSPAALRKKQETNLNRLNALSYRVAVLSDPKLVKDLAAQQETNLKKLQQLNGKLDWLERNPTAITKGRKCAAKSPKSTPKSTDAQQIASIQKQNLNTLDDLLDRVAAIEQAFGVSEGGDDAVLDKQAKNLSRLDTLLRRADELLSKVEPKPTLSLHNVNTDTATRKPARKPASKPKKQQTKPQPKSKVPPPVNYWFIRSSANWGSFAPAANNPKYDPPATTKTPGPVDTKKPKNPLKETQVDILSESGAHHAFTPVEVVSDVLAKEVDTKKPKNPLKETQVDILSESGAHHAFTPVEVVSDFQAKEEDTKKPKNPLKETKVDILSESGAHHAFTPVEVVSEIPAKKTSTPTKSSSTRKPDTPIPSGRKKSSSTPTKSSSTRKPDTPIPSGRKKSTPRRPKANIETIHSVAEAATMMTDQLKGLRADDSTPRGRIVGASKRIAELMDILAKGGEKTEMVKVAREISQLSQDIVKNARILGKECSKDATKKNLMRTASTAKDCGIQLKILAAVKSATSGNDKNDQLIKCAKGIAGSVIETINYADVAALEGSK